MEKEKQKERSYCFPECEGCKHDGFIAIHACTLPTIKQCPHFEKLINRKKKEKGGD